VLSSHGFSSSKIVVSKTGTEELCRCAHDESRDVVVLEVPGDEWLALFSGNALVDDDDDDDHDDDSSTKAALVAAAARESVVLSLKLVLFGSVFSSVSCCSKI
jgi:hypothetical protein